MEALSHRARGVTILRLLRRLPDSGTMLGRVRSARGGGASKTVGAVAEPGHQGKRVVATDGDVGSRQT